MIRYYCPECRKPITQEEMLLNGCDLDPDSRAKWTRHCMGRFACGVSSVRAVTKEELL